MAKIKHYEVGLNETQLDELVENGSITVGQETINVNEIQFVDTPDTDYTNAQIDTKLSGKADKVSSATNNHFAGLDSNGNLTDSGVLKDSPQILFRGDDTKVLSLVNSVGTTLSDFYNYKRH